MGLYDMTPMEQFQKLQTMMDKAVEPKPEVEDRQVLHAAHRGEVEKVLQKAQDGCEIEITRGERKWS